MQTSLKALLHLAVCVQTCTHSKHVPCVQFTVPVSERKSEREVSRGVVGSFEKDARLHV